MPRLSFQVVAILVFAATLFFVWDFSQRVVTNIRLAQIEKQLEQEVSQAQAKNAALRAQKTRAASPEFAEGFVRSQWHWVRDGETLVIPQVTPAAPPPASAQSVAPKPETPWWQNLFDFLFGP